MPASRIIVVLSVRPEAKTRAVIVVPHVAARIAKSFMLPVTSAVGGARSRPSHVMSCREPPPHGMVSRSRLLLWFAR